MAAFSNPGVERGVLAGICQYGREGYLEVSDLINSNTFTIDLNRGMYTCLSHIFEREINTKIDNHLILAAVKDLGLTNLFENDHTYVDSVVNFHAEFSNLRMFAKKIRRLSEAKMLYEKHKETQGDLLGVTGDETMSAIIALSENKILEYTNSLSSNNNEGIVKISEGLEDFVANLASNPREIVGISTGYGRLDKAMGGGARRKSVNIFAARPGIGKTLLADSIALHSAGKLHIPVLELDTEMDLGGHWPRMLAAMTHVKIEDIETGRFAKNLSESKKIDKAVKILKSMPFSYMNVSGKEFEEILSIARRWVMQTVGFNAHGITNDCMFIYDYLKMMNGDEIKSGAVKEHQVLGFQITALHDFTVKYDLPCISFVQVNRDGISKETSDIIADSDRILRLASSVFLYKVKDPEEIATDGAENGNRKMVHIKTRYGGGLDQDDYINFKHTKDIGKIEELNTRNAVHTSATKPKKGFEIENADEPPDF